MMSGGGMMSGDGQHIDAQPGMVQQVEMIGDHAVTRHNKTNLGATILPQEWRTGLLCCCEGGAGSCLYGFCCPPCAVASARSRLDNSDWWMNLFFLNSYTAYKLVAERYNIETDACCDCYNCQCDICRGFWCMPCIVVQMLNEVKGRTPQGPSAENSIYFGPTEQNRNWHYNLFSCCSNMDTCPFITVAGVLPGIDLAALAGFNAQALTMQIEHQQKGSGLNRMEHGYNCEDCFTCGYDGWWFNWCCVNPVITRNYIRDQNRIGGCCQWSRCLNIICNDVMPTWCCYWCSTCQNLNQVIFETSSETNDEGIETTMNQLQEEAWGNDENRWLTW